MIFFFNLKRLKKIKKDSCYLPIKEKEILISLKKLHEGKTLGVLMASHQAFIIFFSLDIKFQLMDYFIILHMYIYLHHIVKVRKNIDGFECKKHATINCISLAVYSEI